MEKILYWNNIGLIVVNDWSLISNLVLDLSFRILLKLLKVFLSSNESYLIYMENLKILNNFYLNVRISYWHILLNFKSLNFSFKI